VKKLHYSGKVVNNSKIHLGVFLNGKCEGVMQFGSPMMKTKALPLVKGTGWNQMLELNRMAFSDVLPKNSESRAIAMAMRLIKKNYPFIKWILSYADATQCGDGTIYRASGFTLTGIKRNTGMLRLPDGSVGCQMTFTKGKHILRGGGAVIPEGATRLEGFQLRYIYFIDKSWRPRLTVAEIPFSRIDEIGAGMYKGESIKRTKHSSDASGFQSEEGGVIPTCTLHKEKGC
jgi:hypothetical protein